MELSIIHLYAMLFVGFLIGRYTRIYEMQEDYKRLKASIAENMRAAKATIRERRTQKPRAISPHKAQSNNLVEYEHKENETI